MKKRLKMHIVILIIIFLTSINFLSSQTIDSIKNQRNLYGWEDTYPEGGSTGATIYFENNMWMVVGTSEEVNYGSVYREIEINLDEYPILEISVSEVSEGWYLIIHSNRLTGGYKKIDGYNINTGVYEYNLQNITQLKGTQKLKIGLGVTIQRDDITKNINQYMKFKYIKFKSLNNHVAAKEIDVNTVSLKNKYTTPESLNLRNILFTINKDKIKTKEIKSENEKENIIYNIFNSLKKNATEMEKITEPFKFQEFENYLSLNNNTIELRFDKNNGALLNIINVKNNKVIIENNKNRILWKLELMSGESISSKDLEFQYKYEKDQLVFNYKDEKTTSVINITIIPNQNNYIDFDTTIVNNFNKDILNFSFPETILFDYKQLEQFIFPYKLGINLNKKFFAQKRKLSEKYPNLFCDFVSLELNANILSIYGIQNGHSLFQPAILETGYDYEKGNRAYFTHKYGAYIRNKSQMQLPVIRFNFNPLQANIKDYKTANLIDKIPDLKYRINKELFDKLKKSVLLKIDMGANRDFNYIQDLIQDLNSPAILHFVTYWKGGFDRNYPDFLPPDERFGTKDDFINLCRKAKESGFIVMPYINPTWWNDSESLNKFNKELITMKDLAGNLVVEKYNNSLGYVVNPFHTNIIKKNDQNVEEFYKNIPTDILFEDQLGARPWIYGINPELPSPNAYIQGIINMAQRDAKKLPLFTEEGFDRLMPYEIGFCNMSTANELPPDGTFNLKFGINTWSIFPLALYLAHEKIAFYQHNLAHEVFADSVPKITWNLLYGHNLNIGTWYSEWKNQYKSYIDADVIQKEIIAEYFGKPLTEYREIDDKVFISQFDNIIVLGNLSDEDYIFGDFTIARNGFMVVNQEGTLMAGVFTRFNGNALGGERILLMKQKENEIFLKQLSPDNCFVTIPKPDKWDSYQRVDAYYQEESIPLLKNKNGITIYCTYGNSDWYRLVYNPKIELGVEVKTTTKVMNNKVGVDVELLSYQKMENVKLGVITYLVDPLGEYPRIINYAMEKISKSFPLINEGERLRYQFQIPSSILLDQNKFLWLHFNIYEKKKDTKQIPFIVDLSYKMDITFENKKVSLQAGESKEIKIFLNNYLDDKVQGQIIAEYPKEIKGKRIIPFIINKNKRLILMDFIKAKENISQKLYSIKYSVKINQKVIAKAQLKIQGLLPEYRIDFDPLNTLLINFKNKLTLNIMDLPDEFRGATISLQWPKEWVLTGWTNNIALNSNSNNGTYEFFILPKKVGLSEIKVKIIKNKKEISYSEKFKIINSDNVGLLVSDINGDKINDIVMGNNKLEILIVQNLGARILKIINRETGNNQLFCDYPGVEPTEGERWQEWAEYGGLNDWWPSGWPGDIWNNTWDFSIVRDDGLEARVDFYSKDLNNTLKIKKQISLRRENNYIKFNYEFVNLTDDSQTFFYNTHPDFSPGVGESAGPEDYAVVPVLKNDVLEIKEVPFEHTLSKQSFIPAENWALVLDKNNNEYLGQIFEMDKVNEIGMWQGINFFSLELLSKSFTIEPNQPLSFKYYYFIGNQNWREDLKNIKKEVNQ